jgi:hypothetical protein
MLKMVRFFDSCNIFNYHLFPDKTCYLHRLTATAKGAFSFQTGFLTQFLARETNHWTKGVTKLNTDLLQQNLLFFPIKLFGNQWSLFVAIALPCIGKNNTFTPMFYYLDPAGNKGNQDVITKMSIKIQHLLNIMWQSKFGSKVDKIENPFSKRSLPLWCPKGKNCDIVSNDTPHSKNGTSYL